MAKGGQSRPRSGTSAMKGAWKLLDAGDVVAARRAAKEVLAKGPAPEEEGEARDLLARTAFPKEGLILALAAATLIALLILVAVLRG